MQHWWIIWQLNEERLQAAEAEREQRRRWAIARAGQGASEASPRAWTLRLPRVALTITLQPSRSRS